MDNETKILGIILTEEELRKIIREEIAKFVRDNISSASYTTDYFYKVYNKE